MGRDYIYGKVSTMALCSLTVWSLANYLNPCQKQSNSRCSWVCIYPYCVCIIQTWYVVVYMHVWASALLVSTRMGNARRQDRGTSNRYSNPHFFVSCTKQHFKKPCLCRVAQGVTWPMGLIIHMDKKEKRAYVVPKLEVYKLKNKCYLLAGSNGTGNMPGNPNYPI